MKKLVITTALFGACCFLPHFLQAAPKITKPKPVTGIRIQGRVKASTKPPRPGSVPYKDAVIALHLTGVQALGGKSPREIVVFVWGMRGNRWTPAATYRPGQIVRLRLTPWEKAERKVGRYNRFELQDEATYDLENFWGE
jgi:hypothetical protein